MSLRNVTLTAVAALSFGMAAHAQTTTITVPLTEPGAAAPNNLMKMNAMIATHRKISTLIAEPSPRLNALNRLL